ncbi:MAG: glycosyltransferase family 4 protein [Oscillospiraceae bacterium]|nr:glycosyltransferase family 4 protein [Oscillospiraceae bacterium]
MKILVVCQYYYPEPLRVSDLCEELTLRGHEVQVVTGRPNYPEGEIYPGYEDRDKTDETIRGVKVHRCPIVPRGTDSLHRFLNYFSYPLSAARYVKRLPSDYDLVFINQLSPVMMAWPGMVYQRKWKKPAVLYCLDLWPESLMAGGVRKGSLIYRAFHLISGSIYRRMDRILVTSRSFLTHLEKEHGVPREKAEYLPQYAETVFDGIEPRGFDGTCRLLFAGNIGKAQSLDTVLDAAERLKNQPVLFQIAGGGTELTRLQQIAADHGLTNVCFFGRRPLEEMRAFYQNADAMLVTLRADPVLSLTLPGKVQSYMAAGRPIIGAINGETADVVREAKCGFCGPAEDAEALAENIRLFVNSADKASLGKNARAYYTTHFQRVQFMEKLEKEMRAVL